MFGIGTPELLVILAVALIVIGPKKLPDLAKSLGRALGEFKRATNDLKQSIEQETGLGDVRDQIRNVKNDVLTSVNPLNQYHSEAKTDTEKDTAAGPSSAVAPDGKGGPDAPDQSSNMETASEDTASDTAADDQGKTTV